MGIFKLTAEQQCEAFLALSAADDANKAGKKGAVFGQIYQTIDEKEVFCQFHFVPHEKVGALRDIIAVDPKGKHEE